MMIQHSRTLALATVFAAGMALLPVPGAAQTALQNMGPSVMNSGQQPKSAAEKPKVAPPPALPGAASNQDQAAPPTRLPNDMEPTEALFDAINRGDIGAARDAISRGADLAGHNVLGMTPMELGRSRAQGHHLPVVVDARRRHRANRAPPPQAATQVARQQVKPARTARAPVTRPAAPPSARLFANDGGTPIPNAGFLGFDASRR